MTDNQQPAPGPPATPAGEPPHPPTEPRSRTWLWVTIGTFVGLLVGFGIGAQVASDSDTTASAPAAAEKPTTTTTRPKTTTTERETTTTTERPTTTTAPPYVPVPTDFFIEVVELERSCFGSAGCNVTFTITPSYIGAQPPAAGSSFKVLYDIVGAEDPKSGYFTVDGDSVRYTEQETVSVPPGGTLAALPTRVLEQ